jgi:hypothetical protein
MEQKSKLLGLLLLGTGIFNAADYFVTLIALERGFSEANPVMSVIVHTVYFVKLKLVVIPLLLVLVWVGRRRVGHRLYYYAWGLFASYGSLMIYFIWLFWRGYL